MPWWGWALIAWGAAVAWILAVMKVGKRADDISTRQFFHDHPEEHTTVHMYIEEDGTVVEVYEYGQRRLTTRTRPDGSVDSYAEDIWSRT